MSDASRPASLRITCRHETEQAFVAAETRSLGRTWVVLQGTGPRPIGELVRFEVSLAGGAPLLRGQGKVVGYRVRDDERRPAGLEVRLTRLDGRSKELLDRVTAARRASVRPPSMRPPPSGQVTLPPLPPPPCLPVASSPEAPAAAPAPSEPPPASTDPGMPASGPRPSIRAARRFVVPPPDREEILDRLRSRARQLAVTRPAEPKTHEQAG